MLELYFEKNWALPEQIVMVADEEAAVVSFSDPKGIVSFNMTCLRANKNCTVWIKLCEHLSISPAGNPNPMFDSSARLRGGAGFCRVDFLHADRVKSVKSR